MDSSQVVDLVVVGGGAAGLSAAVAARSRGLEVLVLDKGDVLGGTLALSGGVIWLPNNPVMRMAGASDSREDGLAYLEAAVGDSGPATSRARKETYLDAGSRMISLLQSLGVTFGYVDGYPDYYPELPGGSVRGRSIQATIFDRRKLGALDGRLRVNEGLKMNLLIRNLREALHIPYAMTTLAGLKAGATVVSRTAVSRATGARRVSMGNALASHLLFHAARLGARFETRTPLEDLVVDGDTVTGVLVRRDGRSEVVNARHGVVLAAGGFARNEVMRKAYGPQPSSTNWTLVNPDDTGDAITIGLEHGGAVALMEEAIWTPMTVLPSGKPSAVFWERCAPHSLIVNGEGKRFCNESGSYMEVGQKMYAHGASPGWIIFDSRHRRRYPFGDALAGVTPKNWITSGYLKKATTVGELAKECDIDPSALTETVRRFNRMAQLGVDEDFGRGASAYDRMEGDDAHKPNPNLGTVERAPLYAVQVHPGDVSTCGGLVTDEHARVLREDGSVIKGLYAAGSTAATVMGRAYPGAGASLGPATVFGYVAAMHAADAAKR